MDRDNTTDKTNVTAVLDRDIGLRLTAFRQDAGLTRSALAAKADIPLVELAAHEDGRLRLGAARMFTLCQILGLRPADFLRGLGGDDAESSDALHDPSDKFQAKDP